MADTATVGIAATGTQSRPRLPRIPVLVLGLSLSIFLALTYLLCALFLALFPDMPVSHSFLGLFVPWFKSLDWYDLLNGLIEAIVDGWYIAAVFGTLFDGDPSLPDCQRRLVMLSGRRRKSRSIGYGRQQQHAKSYRQSCTVTSVTSCLLFLQNQHPPLFPRRYKWRWVAIVGKQGDGAG